MKYTITTGESLDKVREWIRDGRAVRMWTNCDLSCPYSSVLTPGDVETPPHWRYTLQASELLTPEDIGVQLEEPLKVDPPVSIRVTRKVRSGILPKRAAAIHKSLEAGHGPVIWSLWYQGFGMAGVEWFKQGPLQKLADLL